MGIMRAIGITGADLMQILGKIQGVIQKHP